MKLFLPNGFDGIHQNYWTTIKGLLHPNYVYTVYCSRFYYHMNFTLCDYLGRPIHTIKL